MKKIAIVTILAGASLFAAAQTNSFLLYSIKGSATVVENKSETPAKIGKVLSGSSSLKVSNGSIVTIICNEVAMFTVRKPGTYTMAQFKDSCAVNNSSFSANYVKYVWNQMTSHAEAPGSNRKAYMTTIGAVSRGINNIWIDPRLDTVNYVAGEFPLSWKSYAEAKDFEFSLFSSSDPATPVYKTVVGKLKISIATFADKLKAGNSYLWTSAVRGEQNEEMKVLNVVSKDTYTQLLASLKGDNKAFEAEAEQAYRLAFLLEDAHYLAEAYQYYTKAATADPTNPLYRATLMSFKKDYEIK